VKPGTSVGRRSCSLDFQYVHRLPLEGNVGADDLEVVAKGLSDISVTLSTSVTGSDSNGKLWAKVSNRIKALRA